MVETTATQYLVKISDDAKKYKAILTLDPPQVEGSAIDFVFNYVGNPNTDELVQRKVLGQEYVAPLARLKELVFDKDPQGLFIRDGIGFAANGKPVENPDSPFSECFQAKESGGLKYFMTDLEVMTPEKVFDNLKEKEMRAYKSMFILHQIFKGFKVDVTHEDAFLDDVIKDLEGKSLLEVDVPTASWKLTQKGREAHRSLIDEAQELIRRYDIYCDVDFDRDGTPIFSTGTGRDIRVPIYDLMGINPFRARFVLGINDGEFDAVADWPQRINDSGYFDEVFEPVEKAPTVDDIGQDKLEAIVNEGNAVLRERQAEDQYRGGGDDQGPGPSTTTVTTYETYPSYGYGYYDPYFDRVPWWVLFI